MYITLTKMPHTRRNSNKSSLFVLIDWFSMWCVVWVKKGSYAGLRKKEFPLLDAANMICTCVCACASQPPFFSPLNWLERPLTCTHMDCLNMHGLDEKMQK